MMNPRFLVLPAALVISHDAQAMVYLSVEQAQALMFPGQTLVPVPVVLSAADLAAIEKDCGVPVYPGSLAAWKAPGGYFFTDSVIGKHDLIRYAVAIDDGRIREVEILEYREAYGGEVRNSRWLHQFVGLQHGASVKVGRGIQNISGATLSSQHVTDGIRRLLATYAIAFAGR
ncbi:MAG TPA: FMN-binding protein [Steroidobacteraceae bacterium]|nr:FMN-binding protein [Steroidobacteraceae bacterium]